jgi:ferritin-like metal-binding protein YciE
MEKMNDLKDLLKAEIQDLYSVEEQIIEALPKMISKANDTSLKNSLSEHLRVTEEHKKRLDKIQQTLNKGTDEAGQKKGILSGIFGGGKHTCKGMQGIIEEGNKMMGQDMTPEVLDAAIIACAQKVEHYEICGYGTARTYARELKMEQVALVLEQTLNEEYEADDRLTTLAVQRINLEAGGAGAKSGDRSASGSASGRTGRDTTKERTGRKEAEMATASNKRSSGSSSRESEGGKPKSASVPRSGGSGRGAASAKKSGSTSKAASKSTGGTSGRSASGGRSGSTSRNR